MKPVCHIDANYYYAQIEALYRPEIRGKAFVVGGDRESRKGIVLTKSPSAKKMEVKTGSSIAEALKICPGLIIIPANYALYLHFSQRMREIVLEHTEAIKPFGSDEMWAQLHGTREEARKSVEDIRRAIWQQLCLTMSIGVADNLPYAKIGSDLAAENEVCELWNEDKEKMVYPLPISDLLYVGAKTADRFRRYGIFTIGDLANSTSERVCQILNNKTGGYLWTMATGQDRTTVERIESPDDIKSIGNSNTMPRDLVNDDDVRAAFYMLGESVAERMRENGFQASVLQISVRDNGLLSFERQMRLDRPTNLACEMVPAAMELFKRHYNWRKPIRSLGIRGTDLVPDGAVYQLTLFEDEGRRDKMVQLERCVDRLRGRFGQYTIIRAVNMEKLKSVNANNDKGDAQTFYVYR